MVESMTVFNIWCRTAQLRPRQFVVTVCAVPNGSAENNGTSTSEIRVVGDHASAQAALPCYPGAVDRK